ncbi:unnamed protein product [Gulo gulo]|uniref:Uncharacterized protein n=1 Tax=Gulo gulo TaxID=48420 RepID=A0A9X9LGT3_GULGU|nr:unnamed protein product [Gulo gulo]
MVIRPASSSPRVTKALLGTQRRSQTHPWKPGSSGTTEEMCVWSSRSSGGEREKAKGSGRTKFPPARTGLAEGTGVQGTEWRPQQTGEVKMVSAWKTPLPGSPPGCPPCLCLPHYSKEHDQPSPPSPGEPVRVGPHCLHPAESWHPVSTQGPSAAGTARLAFSP